MPYTYNRINFVIVAKLKNNGGETYVSTNN